MRKQTVPVFGLSTIILFSNLLDPSTGVDVLTSTRCPIHLDSQVCVVQDKEEKRPEERRPVVGRRVSSVLPKERDHLLCRRLVRGSKCTFSVEKKGLRLGVTEHCRPRVYQNCVADVDPSALTQ